MEALGGSPSGWRWSQPPSGPTSGSEPGLRVSSIMCGPTTTTMGTILDGTSALSSQTCPSPGLVCGPPLGELGCTCSDYSVSLSGALDDLPNGIDAVGLRALSRNRNVPPRFSALAAEVDPAYQGFGLSRLVIKAMGELARLAGLAPLVAPVRPSWKSRYPLTPIERYAVWVRQLLTSRSTLGCVFMPDWEPRSCALSLGLSNQCTSFQLGDMDAYLVSRRW